MSSFPASLRPFIYTCVLFYFTLWKAAYIVAWFEGNSLSSDEGLEVKGTDIDVVGQGARDETDAAGKGSASQLRSINNPN